MSDLLFAPIRRTLRERVHTMPVEQVEVIASTLGNSAGVIGVHFDKPQGKGVWMRVIIQEGRKRQIRETCKQLALPIVRIVRVRN